MNKREERAQVREEARQQAITATRSIWRSVTNERSPWGSRETKVYWKLDNTESGLLARMRLKLKRNYNFNEHRDALKAPRAPAADATVDQKVCTLSALNALFAPSLFILTHITE